VVVANAGVGVYGPFLEIEPELIEEMIDVNLKGTLHTAAATLPHLIESGAGDFVSIASVAGLRAFQKACGPPASAPAGSIPSSRSGPAAARTTRPWRR
jgi:3-oxoacyl-[acyl-carrier protein] reductase